MANTTATGAECATAATERFRAVVAALDARLGGGGVTIDYDALPVPGDTVVVLVEGHVKAMLFDEASRPWGRARVLGVLRG